MTFNLRKLLPLLVSVSVAVVMVLAAGLISQPSHADSYSLSPGSISLLPGQTKTVTVKLIKNNKSVDGVRFQWDYDDSAVVIKDANGNDGRKGVTGKEVKFTIKRLRNGTDTFTLIATKGGYVTKNNYTFTTVNTDLQYFHVYFKDVNLFWRYFVSEGGSVPESKMDVRSNDGNIVPKSAYTLVAEKYVGFDSNKGEEIFTASSFPLKHDPKGSTDSEGNDTSGTAVYRIYAVANSGQGYSGKTAVDEGYVVVCSNRTLHSFASDVDLGDKHLRIAGDFPDLRYEFKKGTNAAPVVKIGSKKLKAGTDYTVKYINTKTGKSYTSFPTAEGFYNVVVTAKGSYYYSSNQQDYIKIGKANTMKVTVSPKTKKIKAKKLKKKALTYKPLKVTKANGKVSYTIVGGNQKSRKALSVNENTGKVTVAKKTKKGTYSVKVNVTADGVKSSHIFGIKVVTVKVKVK